MKTTRMINLLFLGPQGSGKGTQAKLLAEKFGMKHLSSGEALRQTAKQKTPLGRYLARQLATGSLTPVAKLLEVFEAYIGAIPLSTGIIFDGFARQISETRILLRKLKGMGRGIDAVIMIDISERETIKRLGSRLQCDRCNRIFVAGGKIRLGGKCPACGGTLMRRPDDQPSAIAKRLAMYRKRTLPVTRYFASIGLLTKIRGEQTVAAVQRDILRVLKSKKLIA